MNNQEQNFCSEKYQDSKGYKYLANKLDNFISTQKSNNKLTSKVIFKHLLKIGYLRSPSTLIRWSFFVAIMAFAIAFCTKNIITSSQSKDMIIKLIWDFSVLIFIVSFILFLVALVISDCQERKIKSSQRITTLEKFFKYNIISDHELTTKLTKDFKADSFNLEDLMIFEKDLEELVKIRKEQQRLVLFAIPVMVVFYFAVVLHPTISNIKSITQGFAQLKEEFSLISIVTLILNWIFNIKPRDITLYERFLHILSKVKIKANL